MTVMNCGVIHWPELPEIAGLPPELRSMVQRYIVPVIAYNLEQDVYWHALNEPRRKLPRKHKSVVTALAFDETGQFLATGGGLGDFTVYVWHQGVVISALRAHWNWIVQVVFCTNTPYIVTVCDCGIVRVWDRDYGRLQYVADVPARHVAFNKQGTRMILSGYTAEPTMFLTKGYPAQWHAIQLGSIGRVVRMACFHPIDDLKYILYCSVDGFMQVMNNLVLAESTSAPFASDLLHFENNCVFLARCSGQLWGYDLTQNEITYTYYGHTSLVTHIVLRDMYLLSICKDGKVCLWDRKTSKLLYVLHFKRN